MGDKYCNGRVDVWVEPCNDARSDHTPLVGGRGGWAGGDIGWETERVMGVLVGAPSGTVGARVGAAGAEAAEGSEGLDEGNAWDRNWLGGNDGEDVADLWGPADRDGPR